MDWFDLLAIQGDELIACYTEWSKSETERQISYIKAYTWSLERWYWWNYLQSSSGDTDVERRHVDTERGRRGWDEWRKQHGNIHTTACKISSQWEFSVWLRELKPVLCDNLEGWEGERGGRFRREGTFVYLWLIRADLWQKPTQYCKAIILQLKIN